MDLNVIDRKRFNTGILEQPIVQPYVRKREVKGISINEFKQQCRNFSRQLKITEENTYKRPKPSVKPLFNFKPFDFVQLQKDTDEKIKLCLNQTKNVNSQSQKDFIKLKEKMNDKQQAALKQEKDEIALQQRLKKQKEDEEREQLRLKQIQLQKEKEERERLAALQRQKEAEEKAAKEAEQKRLQAIEDKKIADELERKRKEELQKQIEADNVAKQQAEQKAEQQAKHQEENKQKMPASYSGDEAFMKSQQESLVSQGKSVKEKWLKMAAYFDANKKDCDTLARPYVFTSSDGTKQNKSNVSLTLNPVLQTIDNPGQDLTPQQRDQKLAQHAQKLQQILLNIKNQYQDKPRNFQYAIYYLLDSAFIRAMFKPAIEKGGTPEESIAKLRDFQTNVFDRLNDLIPELRLKEFMIGFCCGKCDLFLPVIPQSEDHQPQDERSIITRSGFRIKPDGKRFDAEEDQKIMKLRASIFFTMHVHRDYLGRGLLFITTLLNLPFQQFTSQILKHSMDIVGPKLQIAYKGAFKKVLLRIKTDFLPKYILYTNDKQGMWKEYQNKPEYLRLDPGVEPTKDDNGIYYTIMYTNMLSSKVDELLNN